MQVQLVLRNWKIICDKETQTPKVAGKYSVLMGEKEIASQDFNEGYGCREIPFSGDTIQAIMNVENVIRSEMEKLLA